MTAEDPFIGVDFVQNNQRKPFEKISPGVMKSQQAQVKHIRICYQHPGRIISDFLSFRIRRVPIINAGVQPNPGGKIQKRIKLITFQGLKWEQHKHVCLWVPNKAVNSGNLVTEGFATGCAGRQRYVFALQCL
jgi:hypothetical protein